MPSGVDFNFELYKTSFISDMNDLKVKVESFPENYMEDNNTSKSVLDALLESGIFPTYSFPKDVIGFYIEDNGGTKIEQKPDRSLDMALSEYAPGRILVINKETYKSGGIYSFHSKFKAGEQEHPARPYFESKDYYKPLYYCDDSSCNWIGLTPTKKCPFCGKESINEKYLLKPWGFAPIAGRKQRGDDDDGELSYAENPSYSITPKEDEMITVNAYENLRYSKRSSDPLIILNKGPAGKGFMVCKDCGAAVPGDDPKPLEKMLKPFVHPHKSYFCHHPASQIANLYLGSQFKTDMVVYEIAIDNDAVNVDPKGLWIQRAGQTLAEAMTLAGGNLLDIEFNEIRSGYRLRYANEQRKTFVDVFLFDSLSSGAGYCSALADRTEELLKETKNVLSTCKNNCDSACHECLMHYGNQRVHGLLDRYAALELLTWCENSSLPSALSFDSQEKLLQPLNHLGADYTITSNEGKHLINYSEQTREIVVYPAMWNENNESIPKGAIAISDKLLKYALPKSDSVIRDKLNGVYRKVQNSNPPVANEFTHEFTPDYHAKYNNDGQNQIGMSYDKIWRYLMADTNDENEIAFIHKLNSIFSDDKEKPIYGGSLKVIDNNVTIETNLLWQKSKVVLFLGENIESYEVAVNTDWKAFILSDDFAPEELYSSVLGG